jgi:hypothetical protein
LFGAVAKLASINLRKLVLSPTSSINLGFILREDLLLCSSYLPLGVPNWAVIYTPSTTKAQKTQMKATMKWLPFKPTFLSDYVCILIKSGVWTYEGFKEVHLNDLDKKALFDYHAWR